MRKVLLGILGLAFVLECFFPLGGFLQPDSVLGLFKLGATDDTRFLVHVASWLLLFVTIICGLTFLLVRKGQASGWILSYILGAWWIGIGTSLWLGFGHIENFFLDACKGAVILAAAYASRKDAGSNVTH